MIKVKDDEINIELTQKAKANPRYANFYKWLIQNGVVMSGIDFPVAFGPLGYIGVSASQDLPPNKVVISIPNELLISTHLVAAHPGLGPILQQNQEYFSEDDNDDGEFNQLAMFVLYQKMKGKQSKWYYYFKMPECSETMLSWTKDDIKLTEDPYLAQEHNQFQLGMEECWGEFKDIAQSYPKVFPQEKYSQSLFFESYEFVMTRCYGWTMPGTFLIPLADSMNHSKYATQHYWFNMEFERDEKLRKKEYQPKKRRLDCTALPQFDPEYKEGDLQEIRKQINPKLDYIRDYIGLVKKAPIPQFLEDVPNETVHQMIDEINLARIAKDQSINIWDVPFFSTTDKEDNDSEEEEEEDEGEEKKTKNDMEAVKLQEKLKCLEKIQLKTALKNREKLFDEEKKTNVDLLKQERIKLFQKNEEKIRDKYKLDLTEEDWSWYQFDDKSNHFIIATSKAEKKDHQLYNCYGRRTNRFLLVWYGFCTLDNMYDSFPFRLWKHIPYDKIVSDESLTKDIVFTDYIDSEEAEDGIFFQKEKLTIDDITIEFRLKESKICDELITYVRIFQLKSYSGINASEILITIPIDLKYEIEVLELCLKFIQIAYDQTCPTPIEQDIELLNDYDLSYKERFAAIFRYSKKKIIQTQIRLFALLIQILTLLVQGKDQQQALDQRFSEFGENDDQVYIENRQKLLLYFNKLNYGVLAQKD